MGKCVPAKHYMVDISEKVEQIFAMVQEGLYFTINRGRQYGKTTTIAMLKKRMPEDYICASISFQIADPTMFADVAGFCQAFLDMIFESIDITEPEEAKKWVDKSVTDFRLLSKFITKVCKNSTRKIVLIVDEVDAATNNDIFVLFLATLREKYLNRDDDEDYTFHSVILAGVYDIKNVKQKIILSGKHTPSAGESRENSPWNIAADFEVDMSFSVRDIETMLIEYENDRHTGMNIGEIAREIRFYTSGYPYLVSMICMQIDTVFNRNWTLDGVQEAIKSVVEDDDGPLFKDMAKKVEENSDLKNLLYNLTIINKNIPYNKLDPVIGYGMMFCFLAKDSNKKLIVHNKIFEISLTDYFVSRNINSPGHLKMKDAQESEIIKGGIFDMELCLTKFKQHYAEIYTAKDEKFLEHDGKLIFLTYLKPLINGTGFYHFEPQTRGNGKMDLVIDYLKQQFILELKLWHGNSRHEDAYEQLAAYLHSKNADCGYLLTFDFREKPDKRYAESKWIECDGKRIYDVVVRVGEAAKRTGTRTKTKTVKVK
jgi:hypothetical protein